MVIAPSHTLEGVLMLRRIIKSVDAILHIRQDAPSLMHLAQSGSGLFSVKTIFFNHLLHSQSHLQHLTGNISLLYHDFAYLAITEKTKLQAAHHIGFIKETSQHEQFTKPHLLLRNRLKAIVITGYALQVGQTVFAAAGLSFESLKRFIAVHHAVANPNLDFQRSSQQRVGKGTVENQNTPKRQTCSQGTLHGGIQDRAIDELGIHENLTQPISLSGSLLLDGKLFSHQVTERCPGLDCYLQATRSHGHVDNFVAQHRLRINRSLQVSVLNHAAHSKHLTNVQMLASGRPYCVIKLLLGNYPGLYKEFPNQNIGRVASRSSVFLQKIERHSFPRFSSRSDSKLNLD
jgi:hypothetical protein